jgi:hypothetical protein
MNRFELEPERKSRMEIVSQCKENKYEDYVEFIFEKLEIKVIMDVGMFYEDEFRSCYSAQTMIQ